MPNNNDENNKVQNPFGVEPVDPIVYKKQEQDDMPELRATASTGYSPVASQNKIHKRVEYVKDSPLDYPSWTPGANADKDKEVKESKIATYSIGVFRRLAISIAVVFPLALIAFIVYSFLKGNL